MHRAILQKNGLHSTPVQEVETPNSLHSWRGPQALYLLLKLCGEWNLFSSLDCHAYHMCCFQRCSVSDMDSDQPLELSRRLLAVQPVLWFHVLGGQKTGWTEVKHPQQMSTACLFLRFCICVDWSCSQGHRQLMLVGKVQVTSLYAHALNVKLDFLWQCTWQNPQTYVHSGWAWPFPASDIST